MSRIGNAPITIPEKVEVKVETGNVQVKGEKGELNVAIDRDMEVSLEDGVLSVKRPTEQKRHKAMHGLYRALLANAVEGVSKGFQNKLELVGVGYKASNQGQVLDMTLGYSHNIIMQLPDEVKVETETAKGQNPIVTLSSPDKQLLGQVTAKIRSLRKIEPYKGKGIRFVGEQIRRKAGKTAAK